MNNHFMKRSRTRDIGTRQSTESYGSAVGTSVTVSSLLINTLRAILAVLMFTFTANSLKAQDLVFDGITPAPGSEISSFDFVLKFDLSKIIEANGPADYGIGWQGRYNAKLPNLTKAVTIYKGTIEDGDVVGRVMTSNCTGSTATFIPSSEVVVSLDGVVPESGVTYTVVINNDFKVFTKESGGTSIANTNLNFSSEPLTYTFVGASASADRLSVANCSVERNSLIKEISEISYTFSQPVSVNDANPVEITENGTVVAKSTGTVLSDDGLTVTFKFDNVVLYNSHSYTISLPVGAVYASDNSSVVNDAFNTTVKGDKFTVFELVSSIPTAEQKTIFSTIEGIFDMPEGFEIYRDAQYTINLYAYLYKNEVSEENLLGRLNGTYNATRNGIIWTNNYALEPETKYVLYKPEGEFSALDKATNKPSTVWYNGEVKIILYTPSVAESGIPKVEFQAPVLGKYNDNGNNVTLSNGDKVSEITTIDILQKDLRYSYDGEYLSAMITGNRSIEIYDITEGTPILVKTSTLVATQYETTTYYYTVYRATVNSLFYEGRKYRLVIPSGTITCAKKALQNFAGNEEYTVEFEGSTPTSVELISCSVADNSELSELPCATWTFKGEFVRNPELSANLITPAGGGADPTFVSYNNGETVVRAFFYLNSGEPVSLRNGAKYTLILPEGLIYNAGDPSIKNEEIRINITGVEKAPVKPDYVNFTVEVNGIATVEQQAVKGETVTVTLTPTDDWKIESVAGAKQSGNSLTTPALTSDTTVKVELAYDGAWAKEVSTNVYEIETENIRIFKDGDHIIVEGAKPDQTICVYNIAGLLVNTANSADGMDRVILTVSQNQEYYIVTVAGKAAKIKM